MKVVKIKGKSDIEPLGVCMCDATLAEVGLPPKKRTL